MQEVGGSIPPGSTTLRPSGCAWRSREIPEGRSVVPGAARRAKTGGYFCTPAFDAHLARCAIRCLRLMPPAKIASSEIPDFRSEGLP
jgi:hypothetical protein